MSRSDTSSSLSSGEEPKDEYNSDYDPLWDP